MNSPKNVSSKGQRFRVTLPDGQIATRNSHRGYTHAVIAVTDCRARAESLRTQAVELREVHAAVTAMIAAGDLSSLRRIHAWSNGAGQRGYRCEVPALTAHTSAYYWLPDYRDTASWTEYIDGALRSLLTQADRRESAADELDAGPALAYNVYRWSASALNATKGARELADVPHTTTRVVPVDPS